MNNHSHVYTVDTDTMRDFEEYRRWWKQQRDETETIRFDQDEPCGQAVFGGCPGDDCDRPCSKRMYTPVIDLDEPAVWPWPANWIVVVAVVLLAIGLIGGGDALDRQERVYQAGRV